MGRIWIDWAAHIGLEEALGIWAASEAEEASRGEWRSSTLALDRSTRGDARSWAEREAGRGGVGPRFDAEALASNDDGDSRNSGRRRGGLQEADGGGDPPDLTRGAGPRWWESSRTRAARLLRRITESE